MKKVNKKSTKVRQVPAKDSSIIKSDVKDAAVRIWRYLNKDSKDTFLDADMKDVTKWVFNFLNKDVVGQKIILLEDEKLRTANIVARALKRKRSITKTDQKKSAITQVKKIYRYFNNPFWQNSIMVGNLKKDLDNHLRRMTPATIKGLVAVMEKLQTYFNGVVWDNSIFTTVRTLKHVAMNFGYAQFGVCEKHQQPLVKDEAGYILCIYTDCSTGKCPFEASKAHEEEITFLSELGELFNKMGIIRDK